MIYIEFDEDRMIKEYSVSGCTRMNAKQFADMMFRNKDLAAVVAASLPWYVHLLQRTDEYYAEEAMEVAEDKWDVYLEKAGSFY